MTDKKAVLSGDISYFRLPEILQLVALQRLTGRLSLSRDGQRVDIYVRDGHVAFATGEKRGSREQLGSILVNMGRLSNDALESALKKCGRTCQMLGGALVEDGHVSREDVRAVLLKQTERSIYKSMAWGEGRFAFELGPMPEFAEDMPVELRVEDLILEGVRRIGEGRRISEKIPSLDIVFTRPIGPSGEEDGMHLNENERLVLGIIDGKKDVRGLLDASGLAEFSLLRALYALNAAGMIKKLAPSPGVYRTQYL